MPRGGGGGGGGGRSGHRVAALARQLQRPSESAAESSPPNLRMLANVLDGSDQDTLAKFRALQQFETDATWGVEAMVGDGSADTVQLLRRLSRLFEYLVQDGTSGRARAARLAVLPLVDPALHVAVMAHFGQFIGALEALGSPAIRSELLPLALAGKVLGCFACAEADPNAPFGAGSDAAPAAAEAPATAWGFTDMDVHATASWLPDSEQLLLETPPSMVKWGIAGLPASTHAIVIARLWLPAPPGAAQPLADCGLRGFVVRIRQSETGALLPGISTGVCPTLDAAPPGAALGWLRLSGVRVALSALLGRFGQVRQGGLWVGRDPVPMNGLRVTDSVESPKAAEQCPAAEGEGCDTPSGTVEQTSEAAPTVEAEEVFGSSILLTNGRCTLLRETGEVQAALLYRAVSAVSPASAVQLLQPLAACYASKVTAVVASDVVDAMADALMMVEASLPSIDSLEPPKPPAPPVRRSVSLAPVPWGIDGQGENTPTPSSAPGSDNCNKDAPPPVEVGEGTGAQKGQGEEETESKPSTMTDEERKVVDQAMEKATAAAAAAAAAESSPPGGEDNTTTDTTGIAQFDLPEPSLYSLVDMSLVAEVTTTVAALQYRLSMRQEYSGQSSGSWLWQAVAPQLQALTALRAAMTMPTVPKADPFCCMGAMLCQTFHTQNGGSSSGDRFQQSLVDSGAGAVLGVLSRPARVVVTAQSDDDSLLSTAYMHDTLPSDGLVVLPEDGKVAGGAAATNWQLTVLMRLAQVATASAAAATTGAGTADGGKTDVSAAQAAAQAHLTLCEARCLVRAMLRMPSSLEQDILRSLCDVFCLTCIRDPLPARLAHLSSSRILPNNSTQAIETALAGAISKLVPHVADLAAAATVMSTSAAGVGANFKETKHAGQDNSPAAVSSYWREGVLPLMGGGGS